MLNGMVKAVYRLLLLGVLLDCRGKARIGYWEDLSTHRTAFQRLAAIDTPVPLRHDNPKKNIPFDIENDITDQLRDFLLYLKSYAEMTTHIAGYTIQVYNGNNRTIAFQIKDKLHAHFDSLDVVVEYKQPNFTVQIGRFLDRLEAYPLYMVIKKYFPKAIMRPTALPNKPGIIDFTKPIETKDMILGNNTIDAYCSPETMPADSLPVDESAYNIY